MPKAVLTDAKIRGIKASPGERQEFADALVDGLRLRVSGRSKTWAMRFRVAGKVRTVTLGEFGDDDNELGVADARIKAAEVRKAARKGEVPAPQRFRRLNTPNRLREQIDAFQKRYAAERLKRPESYRWMFDKYVIPHLGDRDITQIRRRELADFLDTIADRHGVTTSRRVGGLLKRLFKFAASRDVVENDPAAALMLPGTERQRERTLTGAEIRALWSATDAAAKPDQRNRAGRVKPHPRIIPGVLISACYC